LVRKMRHRKDPDALIGVGIHPELHRIISHQAIDESQTIRERLHAILCRELGRPDLLDARPEAVAAS
jgi:hypothetical protein